MKRLVIVLMLCLVLFVSCTEGNGKYIGTLNKIGHEWVPDMESGTEYPCTVSGTDITKVMFVEFNGSTYSLAFYDDGNNIVGVASMASTYTAFTLDPKAHYEVTINGGIREIN